MVFYFLITAVTIALAGLMDAVWTRSGQEAGGVVRCAGQAAESAASGNGRRARGIPSSGGGLFPAGVSRRRAFDIVCLAAIFLILAGVSALRLEVGNDYGKYVENFHEIWAGTDQAYVVTEAGFGADLGAEKFLDIKCRMAGLTPSAVVLVATVRALKSHGGCPKADLSHENVEALRKGLPNLLAHIDHIRNVWKRPVVVALNRFVSDTEAEMALLRQACADAGAPVELCDGWAKGGDGVKELAARVCGIVDSAPKSEPCYTYDITLPLKDKIEAIATRIYGAAKVEFAGSVLKQLQKLEDEGWRECPVCIAKTQYSFSDDAKLLGAPVGHTLHIRQVRLNAGAGFVVAFAGDIIAMPGLPKVPAAEAIDVDENGEIVGLF